MGQCGSCAVGINKRARLAWQAEEKEEKKWDSSYTTFTNYSQTPTSQRPKKCKACIWLHYTFSYLFEPEPLNR
ncbi:MAG: hypothetical protein Q6352_008560 [Candidatus Freyrarchaeum guaymaensis]